MSRKPIALILAAAACAPQAALNTPIDQRPLPSVFDEGQSADLFGTDDRVEAYSFPAGTAEHRLARASGGMVMKSQLRRQTNGTFSDTDARSLGATNDLCPEEKFASQPILPFCTAFLVAPNLVVTAGHCVAETACADFNVVFDYGYASQAAMSSAIPIPEANVYQCRRYVARGTQSCTDDYAIIELDRPVTDRTPLPYRRRGEPSARANLATAGYPMGLPLKVAPGQVRAVDSLVIHHDSDIFGGNSGSPVINRLTGEVEGIHVCSHPGNYVQAQGRECSVSIQCGQDGQNCDKWGEATRITRIAALIDEAAGVNPPPVVDPGMDAGMMATDAAAPNANVKVGDVVISEAFVDDNRVSNDTGYEWIELFNTTQAPITLTGCELDDVSNGGSAPQVLGSVIIPSQSYAVFAGAFTGLNGVARFSPNLNNSGDTLQLRCGGRVIDSVSYGSGAARADVSFALRESVLRGEAPHLANDNAASWCLSSEAYSSPRRGSPGSASRCP